MRNLFLALVFAATTNAGYAGFQPPQGWAVMASPPPESGANAMWIAPDFRRGSGDNIALSMFAVPPEETLEHAARDMLRAQSGDRTIVGSGARSSCGGRQSGWEIRMELPMIMGSIGQLQHLAIKGHTLYSLMYTHDGTKPVPQTVRAAFDAFCP